MTLIALVLIPRALGLLLTLSMSLFINSTTYILKAERVLFYDGPSTELHSGLEIRRESENPFSRRFSLWRFCENHLDSCKNCAIKIVRYIDYECTRIQRFSPNRFARIHLDSRSISQISTPVHSYCPNPYIGIIVLHLFKHNLPDVRPCMERHTR